MRPMLDSLWVDPRESPPPRRIWRDYVLFAVLLAAVLIELSLRDEVVWRAVSIGVYSVTVSTVLWRRTKPLVMMALAIGVATVFDLARLVVTDTTLELFSGTFVVILVYALFRWDSARNIAIGSVVLFLALISTLATDYTGAADAIGGTFVLLFSAALGVAIRYRNTTRRQQSERVRMLEREHMARELHDSVAHHVSAIVIQAQAGGLASGSSPLQAALDALSVIEEEATKTLVEMRSIVGALRHDQSGPEWSPHGRIDEIAQLAARTMPGSPRIEVELTGDLAQLDPAIEAAIYRLAQESITNAIRHARNATSVEVRIVGRSETVQLTVSDDGRVAQLVGSPAGHGIVGMGERVSLLGGVFSAGPASDQGWIVSAELPRRTR